MTARPLTIARVGAIGLIGLLLVGLAAAAWLIIESRAPEPGANMALMGLPFVAGLMIPLSMALLAIAIIFRRSLYKGEFAFYLIMSFGWLLPGMALALFG